jgi:hypothetical protein
MHSANTIGGEDAGTLKNSDHEKFAHWKMGGGHDILGKLHIGAEQ